MPRKPRHFVPNAIFHAGSRGVDRQPIFLCDADRQFFMDSMNELLAETDARTIANCLMPNHFHWAIATGKEGFDVLFQRLLTRHAVRFNRLHGRTGHLFEDRHWSFHCAHLDRIEDVIAYIHLNPVRAGLVRHPSAWNWSSYSAWGGAEPGNMDIPRLAQLSGRSTEELIRGHHDRIASELAKGRRGLGADALVDEVAALFGLRAWELQPPSRGENITYAKRVLVERAEREGIALIDVAKSLNCDANSLYVLKHRGPVRK